MKRYALLLAIVGLSMGAMESAVQKTFTGVIYDNRCAAANRARQCLSTKDPKYTLQSGNNAWILSDQKTPAQFAGRKVIVTGTLGPGNTLVVASIALAK